MQIGPQRKGWGGTVTFSWMGKFLKIQQKLQLRAADEKAMEPQEIREGYLVKKVRITTRRCCPPPCVAFAELEKFFLTLIVVL